MKFFTKIRAISSFFVAAALTLFAGATLSKDDSPLIMGVFPRHNPTSTIEMFQPLATYLSTALHRQVRLEASKDFETFWQNVALQRYDIVHYNQLHYIQSHDKFLYEVIAANQEFGENTISSGIIVRKDSGIEKLADLKGRKIIFGGDSSAMVAYIGNKILLQQAGLNENDYTEEFSKNPPNAIFAVFHKQAEAAGTGSGILNRPSIKERIDANQLKFIALGKPMPHLPWAVHGRLTPKLKANIQSALLSLDKSEAGKKILRNSQMTAILPATNEQFDVCRNILKEAGIKF